MSDSDRIKILSNSQAIVRRAKEIHGPRSPEAFESMIEEISTAYSLNCYVFCAWVCKGTNKELLKSYGNYSKCESDYYKHMGMIHYYWGKALVAQKNSSPLKAGLHLSKARAIFNSEENSNEDLVRDINDRLNKIGDQIDMKVRLTKIATHEKAKIVTSELTDRVAASKPIRKISKFNRP